LAYQPGSGDFSVKLTAGTYSSEWFNPTTGAIASTGSVTAAGGNQTVAPPFAGPAVLYLKIANEKSGAASSTTPAPKQESAAKEPTTDVPEKRTVRVAAVQAQGRVIDWRITNSAAVLSVVDKNIAELERIVALAGQEKCDALALPEDTLGLLHWLGVNEAAQREVLPAAVTRMLDRLGSGAAIGDGDIGVQALRVRAVENFVYLVVAHRGRGAMIISPQGKVISQAEGPDGLAMADIDPRGGREGGDSINWQRDMRARLFRERNPAAFSLLTDPKPPVLAKVPIAITKEDAGRIMSRMLTGGEEEFAQASALERAGKTGEAIAAFERLRKEYPGTWIDRRAQERLATLQH
jgi:hypothetical protein